MAIIKCPECQKEISDQAEKCIGCGYPINKKDANRKMYIENNKIGKNLMLGGGILFIAFAAMAYFVYTTGRPETYLYGYAMMSIVGLIMHIIGKIQNWYHAK